MKTALIALATFFLIAAALLYSSTHVHLPPTSDCVTQYTDSNGNSFGTCTLPHRAVDELTNWGQGHAPTPGRCPPGTIEFDTEDGLFLECYRGNKPL